MAMSTALSGWRMRSTTQRQRERSGGGAERPKCRQTSVSKPSA
jgi:hypothetical protein